MTSTRPQSGDTHADLLLLWKPLCHLDQRLSWKPQTMSHTTSNRLSTTNRSKHWTSKSTRKVQNSSLNWKISLKTRKAREASRRSWKDTLMKWRSTKDRRLNWTQSSRISAKGTTTWISRRELFRRICTECIILRQVSRKVFRSWREDLRLQVWALLTRREPFKILISLRNQSPYLNRLISSTSRCKNWKKRRATRCHNWTTLRRSVATSSRKLTR